VAAHLCKGGCKPSKERSSSVTSTNGPWSDLSLNASLLLLYASTGHAEAHVVDSVCVQFARSDPEPFPQSSFFLSMSYRSPGGHAVIPPVVKNGRLESLEKRRCHRRAFRTHSRAREFPNCPFLQSRLWCRFLQRPVGQ